MAGSSAPSAYPRDMVGYGATPPHPHWPNEARVAVQFVINYEEGGESCVLHGDTHSEHLLSEIVGAEPLHGQRALNVESLYEFGSRAGFWRLHRLFTDRGLPCTVFAVAMALERNPDAAKAMVDAGWEVASHGYRWIDYQEVDEATEREHIRKAVEIHTAITGSRPLGLYQGKVSPQTRRLAVEEGGFLYDADSYSDELPYWVTDSHPNMSPTENSSAVAGSAETTQSRPHLVVPYTLDANDFRFLMAQGFNCGDQFFTYLKDTFDQLWEEGATAPRMMSVGLHCRISGRPGRAKALGRFLDYVKEKEGVWVCRRVDIARHWHEHHLPPSRGSK